MKHYVLPHLNLSIASFKCTTQCMCFTSKEGRNKVM